MLLLDKNNIKSIFSMKEAIEANKKAFSFFSSKKSTTPLRTKIEISKYEATTLFMSSYIDSLNSAGMKIVSVFPNNYKIKKPSISATMVLIDECNGEVSCILDGTYLTQLRTGAASGAATDILSLSNSKIGALIGTGGQAPCQLEALLTVRKLDEVRIFSRNFENAKAFADKMQKELSHFSTVLKAVRSSDEAVSGADIITTVTTSKVPVFNGKIIKKGAHINAVGSFLPDMQELDEVVISRADRIFFDSQEAALSESGDFIIPLNKGIIIKEHLKGDLGQVINNDIKGRKNANDITLFKTVGIAVQDLITANAIYQKALYYDKGLIYNFD